MHAVTFTCEIITPMFIYGADGNTPELRPPSIKGALRFWWRALNGHLSLEELKKREGAIFGDTERRSKFNIRVSPTEFDNISYDGFDKTFYSYDGNKRRHNGKAFPTNAMYYLGYGVANWVKEEKKTRFIRPYIPPKTEFIVKINTKKEVLDTIVHTFKVLEQFGGLGSKSRNAFGCFKIKKYELNGIKRQLLQINPQDLLNNTMSDYTAFSKKVNFFETHKKNYKSWEDAFKVICEAYQNAREKIDEWHDWYWRELIALPIVVKGKPSIKDNFLERHSKPYFMHVSKTEKGYKGEVLLMPYNYLEKCSIAQIPSAQLPDYKHDYLEALERFNEYLREQLKSSIEHILS